MRQLGQTQHFVLLVVSLKPRRVTDATAWAPLTVAQARAALYRLQHHRYVEAHGWEDGSRVFRITKAGRVYLQDVAADEA